MMKDLRDGDDETNIDIGNKISLRAGFEPARENPIGFRVQRLNHSAITAPAYFLSLSIYLHSYIMFHRKLHTNITTPFAQYLGSRNSSVGRASDWRSEGPWFNPGFRHRNNRRLAHFLFYFLNICIFVFIFIIQPKIYVVLFSRFIEPTQELLIIGGTPFPHCTY